MAEEPFPTYDQLVKGWDMMRKERDDCLKEIMRLRAEKKELNAALAGLVYWTVENHEIGLASSARNAAIQRARDALRPRNADEAPVVEPRDG